MHKNLITTFSFNEKFNTLKSLNGFQQIISDSAYGTFFTVYAKMKKLQDENDPDFYKIEDAVFYIQNFSGQITVGIDSINTTVDMAYYPSINEPVYFIQINLKPLLYQPFFPVANNELFDRTVNETLNYGDRLEGVPLNLKPQNELAIFDSEYLESVKLKLKEQYLHKDYKILFHLHFVENDLSEDDVPVNKRRFLDEKHYSRQGEVTQKIETIPFMKSVLGSETTYSGIYRGVIDPSIDRPCKHITIQTVD